MPNLRRGVSLSRLGSLGKGLEFLPNSDNTLLYRAAVYRHATVRMAL